LINHLRKLFGNNQVAPEIEQTEKKQQRTQEIFVIA